VWTPNLGNGLKGGNDNGSSQGVGMGPKATLGPPGIVTHRSIPALASSTFS
jgi:hypothetical protein